MVPVTCLAENFGGEVELVTPNPGPKEEGGSQLGEAGLAGENCANIQEEYADSDEQDNFFMAQLVPARKGPVLQWHCSTGSQIWMARI